MNSDAVLTAIGVLFLAGLALDAVGRRVHIPRVTLLILLGVVLGPPVLDLLPRVIADANDVYAPTALTMVAFLLGSSLGAEMLCEQGRDIVVVSITVVIVSAAVVAAGTVTLGAPPIMALVLAGVATATDPAATRDVVRQTGAAGPFADKLLGIVAIDDVWGVLAFSFILTAADMLVGGGTVDMLVLGIREAGGAILLGAAVGLPAARLTGRLKPGEPTLIEALGVVFLTAGLAMTLDVSYLLAGMTCGAVVVNFATHHEQPFNEIERIEWPFMLLFFVMAGASLDVGDLGAVGWIGVAYIVLRVIGRILGGLAGSMLCRRSGRDGAMVGLSLMPQAGVAVGMALVAAERFPEYGEALLAITIASTIVFEVTGPLMTQMVLSRVKAAR